MNGRALGRERTQGSDRYRDPGVVKVRHVIAMLERDGWVLARTRGSHRQYKHPSKKGIVTLPGKASDDLAPGTLNSVLKQAALKKKAKRGST